VFHAVLDNNTPHKFRPRDCMDLQKYLEGNAFGQLVPTALHAEETASMTVQPYLSPYL